MSQRLDLESASVCPTSVCRNSMESYRRRLISSPHPPYSRPVRSRDKWRTPVGVVAQRTTHLTVFVVWIGKYADEREVVRPGYGNILLSSIRLSTQRQTFTGSVLVRSLVSARVVDCLRSQSGRPGHEPMSPPEPGLGYRGESWHPPTGLALARSHE